MAYDYFIIILPETQSEVTEKCQISRLIAAFDALGRAIHLFGDLLIGRLVQEFSPQNCAI